jgi:hypothetical protein
LDRRSVGPRAGLDAIKKRKIFPLPGIEPRPSSPYPIANRLRYTGSLAILTERTEIDILNKKGERLVQVECMGEILTAYKSKMGNGSHLGDPGLKRIKMDLKNTARAGLVWFWVGRFCEHGAELAGPLQGGVILDQLSHHFIS